MNTTLDSNTVIKDLNNLVELDYDAIAAYEAAIERLDSPDYKAKLTDFLGDHQRHIQELGTAIQREGGTPEESGDAKKVLTKGQVVIANLGGDDAILKAMKRNEDQTTDKYEKAVEKGYPEHIQSLLERGLADERRHKSWIESTLNLMS